MHDSLKGLLPREEKERHETWMKAKMMFNNEFIHSVGEWVKSKKKHVSENNDVGGEHDDIDPNDSVSNVGKYLNKSYTTSSVKIKAAAERAALVT